MILHVAFELPCEEKKDLNHESEDLTSEEVRILKSQIRKNGVLINSYIKRIDLFVNQEKYPRGENFLHKIRERLYLLMEENDTFRKVFWKHQSRENVGVLES